MDREQKEHLGRRLCVLMRLVSCLERAHRRVETGRRRVMGAYARINIEIARLDANNEFPVPRDYEMRRAVESRRSLREIHERLYMVVEQLSRNNG